MKIPVTEANAVSVLIRQEGAILWQHDDHYCAGISGGATRETPTPAQAALRALTAAGITEIEEERHDP